jgi:large conductance mechanosensitive channel
MWQELKVFINRGNVIDLAVAVILGGAFNAIISSLVADLIMPVVGILIGGIDFSSLALTVGEANLTYGNLLQAIIHFLIVALVLFLIVRFYQNFQRQEQTPPPPNTKSCTYCFTDIPIKATRCPYCTSQLETTPG